MDAFRRFGAGLTGFLLFFSLLFLPLVMTLQVTVNSPGVIKASLQKSGAYESLIKNDILPSSNVFSSTALSDSGIQKALKDAIPPSYVQTSSEKIVDSVYDYVHGTASSPDFSVNLSSVKTRFADNVAAYVKQKFDALPRCKVITIPSATMEAILQATCLPVGVSSRDISDLAHGMVASGVLFTTSDTFDASTLAGTKQDAFLSTLTAMRKAYPYFVVLVYALPIASVLLAIIFVLLNKPKRRGIKRLATLLLLTGLINGIAAVVGLLFIGIMGMDGLFSGTALSPVTQDVLDSIRLWWLGISGVFIALAILGYGVLAFTRVPQAVTLHHNTDRE